MSYAIVLQGVQKRYDEFALHDINLALPNGQVMGMVGVNGAGKSTLLRILMGLIQADAGSVEVFGMPMPAAQAMVKRDVGYASEDMRLYRGKSLRWHMDFIARIYPKWDWRYAKHLLMRFDLKADQLMQGFSHGQRVKAMLLLSLARHPRLLLLDEPTTGLDPLARQEVLASLSEVLRDEQRSVLFSSHNTHDIEQLSDTIVFLHQGELLASADKESFLESWRRLRCHGTWHEAIKTLPSVISARHSGSLIELQVRDLNQETMAGFRNLGLCVRQNDAMDLEDIFLTTIRAGVK